ncbi:MAG: stage III sporulation protein AB [Clostridium sp.]|nr:stage III sporulation protein AB [Clostridium sp.]
MLTAVGGILVAAGCWGLGFQAATRLREQERALRDAEQGLQLLERELALRETPLPQLMGLLEERCRGSACALFAACRRGLERLDETPFAQSWQSAVEDCPGLTGEGKQALLSLGNILGRYEGGEQCRAVTAVRQELGDILRRAEENRRRMGRVYQMLGLSGGAFLVILLL